MTRTTKVALVALITLLLGFTSPALANELEMTSEPGDVVSFDEPLVAQDVEQVDGSCQIDQDLQLDQEAQVSSDFDGEAIVAQAGSVSGICGTCRWDIDANGKLTIAPANSSSGVLPSSDEVFKNRKTSTGWGWPWLEAGVRITSVKVEKGVHATKSTDNMFYELSFATSMDLSGLDTTGVTSMDWMLADCQMLECLDISSLDNSLVGSEGSVAPPEMHGYTFLGTGNRLQFIKIGEKWDASKAFPYGVNSSRMWSARLQSWVDLHQSSDISGHADTFTTYRSFQDVSYTHWARGVISRAADMSIISGYSGGRFGPDDRIKRGQVAAILWNMAGKPAAGRGARSFPDVKSGAYYYDAVRWASSVGVVSGYANGRFGPEDLVTREQFSAMLANYSSNVAGRGTSGSKADFASMSDAGRVSPWAQASVGWCFRNKIMSGKGGSRIDPQGNATRAEAAKMVVYLHDMIS